MSDKPKPRLFPAILKFWRTKRGMSQLDLALAADVSARHVSFLETGRSNPSRDMVLALAGVLSVPLREQNEWLLAAGFEKAFQDPDGTVPPEIRGAIERMMAQQEPFPMVVMDRHYNLVQMNNGARALLPALIADPSALPQPLNLFEVLFHPQGIRPHVQDWPRLARRFLSALHRESLASPGDEGLAALVERVLAYPDVPSDWRVPDLDAESVVVSTVGITRGDLSLRFLTTVTQFADPRAVIAQELRIESYFPADQATDRACRDLVAM